MKNKSLPFILILFFALPSYGQINDSIRSIYVERFPDHFFVWPVLKLRTASLEVVQLNNRSNKLAFKPNNSVGAGVGVYLFELLAEITFSVPVDNERTEIFGSTKATDLQLNLLGKNWGADVFYQRYSGFYLNDVNKAILPSIPYPQRPDMVTDNFGVNGIYIFNKNKFSLRSPYNFAERQKKNAGSFLLAATINSFQMKADSALYGKSYEGTFGADAAFSELNAFTIGISPGYTHTLVLKNFFINGSFSVGPAFQTIDYIVKDVHRASTEIDTFVDFRVGAGYNGNRFFSGLSYVAQSRNVKFEQAQFTAISSTVKLLVGYRFKEFGILKARAFDLVPFGKKKQ